MRGLCSKIKNSKMAAGKHYIKSKALLRVGRCVSDQGITLAAGSAVTIARGGPRSGPCRPQSGPLSSLSWVSLSLSIGPTISQLSTADIALPNLTPHPLQNIQPKPPLNEAGCWAESVYLGIRLRKKTVCSYGHPFIHSSRYSLSMYWAPVCQALGWAFWIQMKAAPKPCLGGSTGTSGSREMITAWVPRQDRRQRAGVPHLLEWAERGPLLPLWACRVGGPGLSSLWPGKGAVSPVSAPPPPAVGPCTSHITFRASISSPASGKLSSNTPPGILKVNQLSAYKIHIHVRERSCDHWAPRATLTQIPGCLIILQQTLAESHCVLSPVAS